MTTKLIGIKDFRNNLSSIWKESKKKNIRYIVMNHSTPIFEVKPITEEKLLSDATIADINEAREQIKKGEVYTQEEVFKIFGIK